MNRIVYVSLLWALTLPLHAQEQNLEMTVTGGKEDRKNVVVRVPIGSARDFSATVAIEGKTVPAAISNPSLDRKKDEYLVFLLPDLPAGKVVKALATISNKAAPLSTPFFWKDPQGEHPQLMRNGKLLLEYVRPKFDPAATPAKQQAIANPTTKPFHHLYAADGKTRLTNGAEGRFPHHRGIYFGFNNISYDGKKADVWHCRSGESQAHQETLSAEANAVFAREKVRIAWNGQDGKPFADEIRELLVYNAPNGTLLDFSSMLTTELDKVRLDGDPQHAGFHFRAAQDVEKNPKETYFLRPTGKGEKGTETNWDPKSKKGPVNLPWNAMSFVVDAKRYTVVYLDHPSNPKEARQSERTYGRFGTYFEYDLSKSKPLAVKYRLWIQEGEVTPELCQALSKGFVETTDVKVTKGEGK